MNESLPLNITTDKTIGMWKSVRWETTQFSADRFLFWFPINNCLSIVNSFLKRHFFTNIQIHRLLQAWYTAVGRHLKLLALLNFSEHDPHNNWLCLRSPSLYKIADIEYVFFARDASSWSRILAAQQIIMSNLSCSFGWRRRDSTAYLFYLLVVINNFSNIFSLTDHPSWTILRYFTGNFLFLVVFRFR